VWPPPEPGGGRTWIRRSFSGLRIASIRVRTRSFSAQAQSSRITMPVHPVSTAATPARTARVARSWVNVAGS
jgi:hypothetical protein